MIVKNLRTDFGAVAGTNVLAACQAASHDIWKHSGSAYRLVIPSGTYYLSDTWEISGGLGRTILIEGEVGSGLGTTFRPHSTFQPTVSLDPSYVPLVRHVGYWHDAFPPVNTLTPAPAGFDPALHLHMDYRSLIRLRGLNESSTFRGIAVEGRDENSVARLGKGLWIEFFFRAPNADPGDTLISPTYIPSNGLHVEECRISGVHAVLEAPNAPLHFPWLPAIALQVGSARDDGATLQVSNVRLRRLIVKGGETTPSDPFPMRSDLGIWFGSGNMKNYSIAECNISGFRYGISTAGSGYTNILDCDFGGCGMPVTAWPDGADLLIPQAQVNVIGCGSEGSRRFVQGSGNPGGFGSLNIDSCYWDSSCLVRDVGDAGFVIRNINQATFIRGLRVVLYGGGPDGASQAALQTGSNAPVSLVLCNSHLEGISESLGDPLIYDVQKDLLIPKLEQIAEPEHIRLLLQNNTSNVVIGGVYHYPVPLRSYDHSGAKRNCRQAVKATVADLRALDPGVFESVKVLGYHAPNDGGGGGFYWDDDSAEDENGGTVIRPASKPATAAGRWKRRVDGPLSVKWFGAIGDGGLHALGEAKAIYPFPDALETDQLDWAAIQATIHALPNGGVVHIPAGTYKVNRPLLIGNAAGTSASRVCLTLQGDGWELSAKALWGNDSWTEPDVITGSVLSQINPGADLLVRPDSPVSEKRCYRDLALLGPGQGTSRGLVISPPTLAAGGDFVENVAIANFAIGLEARALFDSTFVGLLLRGNDIGLRGAEPSPDYTDVGFNQNVFLNFKAEACNTALVFRGTSNMFYGGVLQENVNHGIILNGGECNVIEGFYCENAPSIQDALRITGVEPTLFNELRNFRTTVLGGAIRVLGGYSSRFLGGRTYEAPFEIAVEASETIIEGMQLDDSAYVNLSNSTHRTYLGQFLDNYFTFQEGAILHNKLDVGIPTLDLVSSDHLKDESIVVAKFHTDVDPDTPEGIAYGVGAAISLSGVRNRGASYIAAIHPTDNKDTSDLTFWTGHNTVEGGPGALQERMRITNGGNVGIGTTTPVAKLQVADGDVYIETIGSGLILRSHNGTSFRVTVDNSGALSVSAV